MTNDTTNESGSNGSRDPRDDPRLTAYVLDELAPEERVKLERELAAEPQLAEEVRALERLSTGLLGALGESAMPRLDDVRRVEILGAARTPEPRRRTGFAIRLAAAAGLVLVVGAIGYLSLRGFVMTGISTRRAAPEGSNPYVADPAIERLRGLGYVGEDSSSLSGLGYDGGSGGCIPQRLGFYEGYTHGDASRPTGDGLEALGTESYDPIAESGIRDPRREPLSTFSIDVDTASYSNVRRFLNERRLPPADAVRIEELVNYFRYDYPEPRGREPFSVAVDAASVPWASEHRLVRIGLRGRAPEASEPKVKNLVFLVDVSGSMDDPAKLPLVQRSLRLLVDQLSPEDRVAIVVYAGSSGLVLPPTSVDSRTRIQDAIENLEAGGSTNGGEGIQLAYDTAQRNFAKQGVNRVILATDGDFNVGITDRGALLRLIEAEAKSGVFLSVLGFGTGNLQDATMEQLADHGNGNYAYVDSLSEARKVLVREMGATLETIAKDVKVQVEFNPARVAAWRLVGYENRVLAARDFADDKKDAGEIGAGHTVTALYEIVPVGAELASVPPLRYQDAAPRVTPAAASSELLTVKLRYKQPDGDTSELLTVPFTDDGRKFEAAAPDLRFAAAVAAFGLCLRDSEQRGSATFRDVYRWAEPALGADPHGDRREFLKLVDLAEGLSGR